MSLVLYGTTAMNFYCGSFLTWKTCLEFMNKQRDNQADTLLIKWFLLYTFIQVEGFVTLFTELIPFGFVLPFILKAYIIMPHSHWHAKLYNLFEQLEMDEQTSQFLLKIQSFTKVIIIKALDIIESYVDMIRVDDLTAVEQKLRAITDRIVTKKSHVQVRKSNIKFRTRPSEQQAFQTVKQPKTDLNPRKLLNTNALVYENNSYTEYILSFNIDTCELSFLNFFSEQLEYQRTLVSIECDRTGKQALELIYTDSNDKSMSQVKLMRPEDTDTWLTPVLQVLIAKFE